jgi:gamma-glutamylcyclotransferase (GGCT)/AIG2-like uncharacterized protein YtfP
MTRGLFPVPDFEEGLGRVLSRINDLRRQAIEGGAPTCLAEAEEIVEDIFGASHHLAIYGSLAPGEANHSVIESVPGVWLDASVRGEVHPTGWGLTGGFPGMKWRLRGARFPVKMFVSTALVDHWARLDEFEGPEYVRILVPVYDEKLNATTVANVYEVR